MVRSDIPFILYSGFQCNIRKRDISRFGKNLKVGLLLTNLFDENDKRCVFFPELVMNPDNSGESHGKCN